MLLEESRNRAHKHMRVSRSKKESMLFKCQKDGSMTDGACHQAADFQAYDAVDAV